MVFWSRERILRGAISPFSAVALWIAVTATLAVARWIMVPSLTERAILHLALGAAAAGFLGLAAYIDGVLQILPDPLLALAGAAAALSAASLGAERAANAVFTGFCGLTIALMLTAATSMGRGDAKLIGALGLWTLSVQYLLCGLVAGLVCAGLFACVLLASGRMGLKTRMALGPWLVLGACIVWISGFI